MSFKYLCHRFAVKIGEFYYFPRLSATKTKPIPANAAPRAVLVADSGNIADMPKAHSLVKADALGVGGGYPGVKIYKALLFQKLNKSRQVSAMGRTFRVLI